MDKHTWYYKQVVTEGDLNDQTGWTEEAERRLARDVAEWGVFNGLQVSQTGPATTSVVISPGVSRDRNQAARTPLLVPQTVACDQDEFGNPTYSDLLPGEGRWAGLYARSKEVLSDLRTDGHGLPVWFTKTENVEFFLHVGLKGPAVDKAILARPGVLTTAVLLADIWFEEGSTEIEAADIDVSRREDYYRAMVAGVSVVAGTPKSAIQQIGAIVHDVVGDLSDPDLPTGVNDGAHKVGLGGSQTEAAWEWQGNRLLDAANNVHEVVKKVVRDLGEEKAQGVPGSRLVSAGATASWRTGSAVDPGSYDGSVGGYLAGVVSDLAADAGASRVGAEARVGVPYSLGATSVQEHDVELLSALNSHVMTAGHPAVAISHAPTGETFADGRVLAAGNGGQRWDELVELLGEMAGAGGPSGSRLVGVEESGATRDAVLTFPGNTTLATRMGTIAYEILGRIFYQGDNRLEGAFEPKNDAGAVLGSILKRFARIFTPEVNGGNGPVRVISESLLDPAELRAEADVDLRAAHSLAAPGEVRAWVKNVQQWSTDDSSFYPNGDGVRNLGRPGNAWKQGYFAERVNLTDPLDTVIHLNAAGTAVPYGGAFEHEVLGQYIANTVATTAYLFIPLGFLKPGDFLSEVSIDWHATNTTNMSAAIVRQAWNGFSSVVGSAISPLNTVRHQRAITPSATIATGFSYYVRVQTLTAVDQRLHGIRVTYQRPIL